MDANIELQNYIKKEAIYLASFKVFKGYMNFIFSVYSFYEGNVISLFAYYILIIANLR